MPFPPADPRKQLLARSAASLAVGLAGIWGGVGGTVGLGLALCEVYYTRNPWVTAQYLAQRHGHISVDTVRRRLEELTEAGLVEFIEPDSRRLYKATTEAADRTIKLVEEALVLPGEQDNDGFVKIARMGEAR